MNGLDIREVFGAALGLRLPWKVASVEFTEDTPAEPDTDAPPHLLAGVPSGRIDIALDYPRASRFPCPIPDCTEQACRLHDTVTKSWRHLDFFQHQAYLSARVPRTECPTHGVHLTEVAWARAGSGFTLLFEIAILTLAKHAAVKPVAEAARIHDTRAWRVISHHVDQARAGLDFSEVSRIGVDETSAKRGQQYVSVFMDLDGRRVLYATPGRDSTTVEAFAKDLDAHGGDARKQIKLVSQDMSDAFVKGVRLYLSTPEAKKSDGESGDASGGEPDSGGAEIAKAHTPEIVFDRYHVIVHANGMVDEVRRAESKDRPELKSTRYLWLKNASNLTKKQQQKLVWLQRPSLALKTMRAARWRDDFNGFYAQPDRESGEAYLRAWCYGAKRSRLEPVKAFVKTVEDHWEGILAWQEARVSNGILEGTNSLIQSAKRRARGYRNTSWMITVIYLIAGKLPLPQIHTI